LEHALWFTLGLVVLWVGFGLGGRLGTYTETVIRVAGGVAIGYVLLAAAVLLGSTVVALGGSVGNGDVSISFTGRSGLRHGCSRPPPPRRWQPCGRLPADGWASGSRSPASSPRGG